MSKERAREIADNPGTSIVSDVRRALLWALDELSARDGEIISLKARVTMLDATEQNYSDQIYRLTAQVADIRAMHSAGSSGNDGEWCAGCEDFVPCRTIHALDAKP